MKIARYLINKNDSIEIAIQKVSLNRRRIIFVEDKKKIIGSVSEGDILRILIYKKNLKASIKSVMNKSFKFINNYDKQKAKRTIKRKKSKPSRPIARPSSQSDKPLRFDRDRSKDRHRRSHEKSNSQARFVTNDKFAWDYRGSLYFCRKL